MDAVVENLLDFIDEGSTSFHVVENIKKKLLPQGYEELEEGQEWRLGWGGKYFVARNHSSLIAFSLPRQAGKGIHMAASHTDSPAFKIKAHPEITTEEYVKFNTEKYGGMILSTWMDRPLSVAGRVFLEYGGEIRERLLRFDRNLLVIPNLAIHMNRNINKGYEYNPQVDLLPIFSRERDAKLRDLVAEELDVPSESVLSEELFVYVRERGCAVGDRGQWLLAPRLDDLMCVYASLEGLLAADHISLWGHSSIMRRWEAARSKGQTRPFYGTCWSAWEMACLFQGRHRGRCLPGVSFCLRIMPTPSIPTIQRRRTPPTVPA